MSFNIHEMVPLVEESYSRYLDQKIAISEKPYGYDGDGPAADTQDFDQARLNDKNQYRVRGGRIS